MATKEVKPADHWVDPATGEYRVIAPGQTFRSITEKIVRIVLTPHTPMGWFALFTVAGGGATVLMVAPSRSRWPGALRLSTSSGGSASATPAR
jgi:molybdopterin-containing oxidoreductase family membrane subunit